VSGAQCTGQLKRRDVVLVAGAVLVGMLPASARAQPPAGRLLAVRGTRLWVTDTGPSGAPVLLYVHGGPGIGALEFERYMGPALAGMFRLISVDQRGVLRSDALPSGTKVTIDDLVDDFEAVREALAVPRWQVLGHSFGGLVALRYALAHPERVQRLVLECPCIDLSSSFRWLCAAAAQLLNRREPARALEATRLADPSTPLDDAFISQMDEVLAALGVRRQDLYVSEPRNRDIFSRLAASAELSAARWEQGAIAGKSLLSQPSTRRAMLTSIGQWKGPMLLIRGDGDHVTSPAELVAVAKAGGKINTVPNAGHFVHVEQPAAMARLLVS
jgi:proline iminopeptidase